MKEEFYCGDCLELTRCVGPEALSYCDMCGCIVEGNLIACSGTKTLGFRIPTNEHIKYTRLSATVRKKMQVDFLEWLREQL
jgi:hypothetical protein